LVPADSSSDDEEVVVIRQNYKKFREEKIEEAKLLAIECAALDEVKEEEVEEDSSEDDQSYDEDSDGQIESNKSHYARYKKGSKFILGMKFSGKKQFKDAIISYGLAMQEDYTI
jgi:hypothetical protein